MPIRVKGNSTVDGRTVEVIRDMPASGGGSGGSAGSPVVRGPFPFAFNTPGIENGVAFYTPTVNDILLEVWVEVIEAFDGELPQADVGPFIEGDQGIFGSMTSPILLGGFADSENIKGVLNHVGDFVRPMQPGNMPATCDNFDNVDKQRSLPAKFVSAAPWKVLAAKNGIQGQPIVGCTKGSGAVYLITATPTA